MYIYDHVSWECCMRVHTHIHIHICTYIHIHIYAHTYTRLNVSTLAVVRFDEYMSILSALHTYVQHMYIHFYLHISIWDGYD